jgi:hypothetical protein
VDSADSLNEDSTTADNVDKPTVDSPSSEGSNSNDLSECEEVIPRNEYFNGNREHNGISPALFDLFRA